MPECNICKAYTKFDNGLCYKCYKGQATNDEINQPLEVMIEAPVVKTKTKKKIIPG